MYSICEIVCGYQLDGELERYVNEFDIEAETIGFVWLYSGAGNDMPMYCGVSIGEFDVTQRMTAVRLIKKMQAKPHHYEKAMRLIFKAKQKLREIMEQKWDETTDPPEELATYRNERQIARLLAKMPDAPQVVLVWHTS